LLRRNARRKLIQEGLIRARGLAVKLFAIFLALVAVVIASGQAYLSWKGRDDHIEAVIEGRRLDACAEIGSAVADFSFRAQAAQAEFNEETFAAVNQSPRALARASYLAAYLLPQEAAEDAARMRDISQRIVGALGQREESRVNDLMREIDAANRRVQESCRLLIQGSQYIP
jgi:hypothetical protein